MKKKVELTVFVEKKEIFTTSKIIANGINYEHESVVRILQNYKEDFEEFGDLRSDLISGNKIEKRGRKTIVYILNEEQTTLLFMS